MLARWDFNSITINLILSFRIPNFCSNICVCCIDEFCHFASPNLRSSLSFDCFSYHFDHHLEESDIQNHTQSHFTHDHPIKFTHLPLVLVLVPCHWYAFFLFLNIVYIPCVDWSFLGPIFVSLLWNRQYPHTQIFQSTCFSLNNTMFENKWMILFDFVFLVSGHGGVGTAHVVDYRVL